MKGRKGRNTQYFDFRSRANRAWSLVENNERLLVKHVKDIEAYYNIWKNKLARYPVSVWANKNEEIWREKLAKAKAKKTEQKVDKFFGDASVKNTELDSKHLYEIVQLLRAGGTHKSFTILPTEKAKTNHAVLEVVDLKDGQTLCLYAHAKNA